jgi:glutathione S-transferase
MFMALSAACGKASRDAVLQSMIRGGTSMAYVDIVTALAVLQFIVFAGKVSKARGKYGVKAPAITGNDIFERYFRVQQNTLEQLIMFLPGLYLFSRYFNPLWAAVLGVVYLIGREIYAASYVKDPAKRGPGYALTFFPSVILIVGAVIGAVRQLVFL